jgi:hypothetical protein
MPINGRPKMAATDRHRHLVRLASTMPSPPAIDDLRAMSNVVQPSFLATSNEMAERLIKAGYLQPALRHDSKAIASAIARMKQDLRGQANDGEGPTAA